MKAVNLFPLVTVHQFPLYSTSLLACFITNFFPIFCVEHQQNLVIIPFYYELRSMFVCVIIIRRSACISLLFSLTSVLSPDPLLSSSCPEPSSSSFFLFSSLSLSLTLFPQDRYLNFLSLIICPNQFPIQIFLCSSNFIAHSISPFHSARLQYIYTQNMRCFE